MLFSLRRKAPKDSPRRCLGLSIFCWEAHTYGSQQLFALASLGKPTFAVREVCATGKLASAGARLSERTRCPFGVFRRGLRTSVVRKHVPGADGIYSRIAPTVKPKACSSFDAFLSVKKSMRSLLSKEEEMSFSHRRENDEKSRRDGVSDSHPSAGKHIHTARKVLQCSRGSHRPPLPVREVCAAGSPRPQAQSCRPHKRSSRRLAASFRSFLVRRGKEHKMLIFFEKHIYKGIICKIILQIIPVNDILTL